AATPLSLCHVTASVRRALRVLAQRGSPPRPSSWRHIPSSPLFVEKVTRNVMPRETASLFRVRSILGLYQGLKVGGLPVNAASILRDGMVLDCCPVERKHRLLKAYASHLRSGPGFERGIFARSILASARIAVAAREDALLRGEVCATTTRTFWCLISFIGNKTSTRRTTLSWRGASPCPCVDERMAAVVVPLEFLSKSTTFSTWRQRRDSPVKVHCVQDGLRLALGWQRRGDIVEIIA
ncbi:unnamed protein product, partial [Effrenium voratum]